MTPTDISRLAYIVFLHDAGKLHPGFQAKCGWPEEIYPRRKWRGHVREGAAIFAPFQPVMGGRIGKLLHGEAAIDWLGDEAANLLAAAFAHHGRPFGLIEPADSQGWEGGAKAGYDPLAAAAEFGQAGRRWFAPAFEDVGRLLPSNAAFQHLFCGLVSLADWLGSTQSIFTFVAHFDPHYDVRGRQLAAAAVAGIGLDVSRWRRVVQGRANFETISGGHAARGAQKIIGAWSLDDQLIILEAETGSGKTEAALWRFAQLFEAGLVDSLYFALPTRAAAKQIHGRVNQAMKRLFGEAAPEAVLAVPGYLQAGETMGAALPDYSVLWDDKPDEAQQLARWAAESSKRYLAAAVSVGTVDQAMLASLKVKHAHLRSAALSRALIVIDECHASEEYMASIQQELLNTHLARGGYAMLMSATLGSRARAKWLGEKETPPFAEAVGASYPAVWGRNRPPQSPDAGDNRQKTVAMQLATTWTPQAAAHHAIAAAEAGARVLVIRNTVKTAVEAFAAVKEAGAAHKLWQVAGDAALHHSRFAPEDRALLDEAVEKALTRDAAQRTAGGMIVIGSQTLEQSLDIDADILITDLCPVDVLLQRIGRLHRHILPRPAGFETPRCIVLSPEGGLNRFASPSFDNGLGAFGEAFEGIYTNLHACELTRRLMVEKPQWTIPDMNRFLVESATHDESIEALNGEKGSLWQTYWNKIVGGKLAKGQLGKGGRLPVSESFAGMGKFPEDEQPLRTRLGAEGARIQFAGTVIGPFGKAIIGVNFPGHWRVAAPEEPVVIEVQGGRVEFAVGERRFVYSREGLALDAKM